MWIHFGTAKDWVTGGYKEWRRKMIMTVFPDQYSRDSENRLLYETCQKTPSKFNNAIKAMKVEGGCCAFYDGSKCQKKGLFFPMEN